MCRIRDVGELQYHGILIQQRNGFCLNMHVICQSPSTLKNVPRIRTGSQMNGNKVFHKRRQ